MFRSLSVSVVSQSTFSLSSALAVSSSFSLALASLNRCLLFARDTTEAALFFSLRIFFLSTALNGSSSETVEQEEVDSEERRLSRTGRDSGVASDDFLFLDFLLESERSGWMAFRETIEDIEEVGLLHCAWGSSMLTMDVMTLSRS